MTEFVLEMHHIQKAFNGIDALKGVDFHLKKGEIHALLGENGAGKTTLMNILGGVLPKDSGQILLDGREVDLSNPEASRNSGISFIHQELNLVPDLKVYENMFLGAELIGRFGLVDTAAMCQRAEDVIRKLDVQINPQAYVRDIETSYKQIVEIARALLQNAKIIIMDEPTTSLAEHEIQSLFAVMRSLKASGVSIIFISHKLKEILHICDRYTVLRDGELAQTGLVLQISEEGLARLMVGKEVASQQYYKQHIIGEPVLEVKRLSSAKLFSDVSFTLHKGEILGFTGLAGDGRTELFESIFGYRQEYDGDILVNGRKVTIKHPVDALRQGIGLVPKNRKENAVIKDVSVMQNLTITSLPKLQKQLLIDRSQERSRYLANQEKLHIKAANPNLVITSLSGGNQQKVIVARWLEAESEIIILDNPTQGIDIGAKSEIYQLIQELAQSGKAIIILSSELTEILRLCDRIFVMYHGRIAGEVSRKDATEEVLMMYATGVKKVV